MCWLQVKLDEKMVAQTLTALNDARITYPGKSEKTAEFILDKVFVHCDTPCLKKQSKLQRRSP